MENVDYILTVHVVKKYFASVLKKRKDKSSFYIKQHEKIKQYV